MSCARAFAAAALISPPSWRACRGSMPIPGRNSSRSNRAYRRPSDKPHWRGRTPFGAALMLLRGGPRSGSAACASAGRSRDRPRSRSPLRCRPPRPGGSNRDVAAPHATKDVLTVGNSGHRIPSRILPRSAAHSSLYAAPALSIFNRTLTGETSGTKQIGPVASSSLRNTAGANELSRRHTEPIQEA
jgi:hypothetical protein